MTQKESSGYKSEELSALKKAECEVGDIIRVTSNGKVYEGILTCFQREKVPKPCPYALKR